MRQWDLWNRPRNEPVSPARAPMRREHREDFGQADYSTTYGYDPRTRTGYRQAEGLYDGSPEYGQADFDDDYGYDPVARRGFRRDDPEARAAYEAEMRRAERHEPRSWSDSTASRLPRARRRGTSDHVLWAVVTERLAHERGLDARDIDVLVHGGEVTLNGTVRRREDKRRAEDLADLHDVHNVQNNLRVRRGFF